MATPTNKGAFITGPKEAPLVIKDSEYKLPGEHEILIKNKAVAVNPVDPLIQHHAPWPVKEYPIIIGVDIAGEVVAVGSKVTRFHVGDRVLALTRGIPGESYRTVEGGFQLYTIAQENLATRIPATLSFESATVLPLGIATAAIALYGKKHLHLPLPSTDPVPSGRTILIWGGASSVESNAIQLAVASGFEVVTTASAKNFDYVKKLGASHVFDYSSPTVVADLVAALTGKHVVGILDAITQYGTTELAAEVASKVPGAFKHIAAVRHAPSEVLGVKVTSVFALEVAHSRLGHEIFGVFLPHALAHDKFVAAPGPLVVGHGLEAVQGGFDKVKSASAQKIVITL